LTAIIDGLPAGLTIDVGKIDRELARRQRGYGRGKRMEIESDHARITSGVINNQTIGAPVTLQIDNKDWKNWKELFETGDLPIISVPRPGHADYAGMMKYAINDARPILERASARETAARVAIGALAKQFLAEFDISIGSYVQQIGSIKAKVPDLPLEKLWSLAEDSDVSSPDLTTEQQMKSEIDRARQNGDSIGGIFTVAAIGVPVGLGSYSQWDHRLDGRLAQGVMSIPAVKGVEIGDGFLNATRPGRLVHDEILPDGHGGVKRVTNRAGGIEGGLTNGSPIILRGAVKPIPSLLKPLSSTDLATGESSPATYQRSDVCVVPAAAVIAESMVAWILADAILEKFGGDSIGEMKR
jgi:chorismate synthase